MNDKDPRVIGARIARRRHQLGWSQVELAERLGVSPSSVANWERGASYPKKKIGKVEQVLGVPLDGLGEVAGRSPPADPLADLLGSASDADEVRRKIRAHKGADAEWYISAVEDALRQHSADAGDPPEHGTGQARR